MECFVEILKLGGVITCSFYKEHWMWPEGGWEHVRTLVYARLNLDSPLLAFGEWLLSASLSELTLSGQMIGEPFSL